MFDKKEQIIFEHYKFLLENRKFDEYDVLAFLILMRRHLNKNHYPYLHDFADLIAHRGRDRGVAMDAIKGAIQSGYSLVPGKKTVERYHGIDPKKWETEWKNLGNEFGIMVSGSIIEEVTLCIFSLAQFTDYQDGAYYARMELFQFSDNCLAIATTEGKTSSLYVCFAKCGPFQFTKKYPSGQITDPVETIRDGGMLRLKTKNDYLI